MPSDDSDAFKQAVKGIKPLKQDKYVAPRKKSMRQRATSQPPSSNRKKQIRASFTFSDLYQAHLPSQGPLRFCRENVPSYILKQLRRGDFAPEWVLDCHGMTKQEMKQELIALLYNAHRENVACLSILHGVGAGVLKQALPHYLVQHPHVRAFHQAPLEFGGHGALLVMIDTISSDQHYYE